jgi:hypothetical protein
MTTWTHKADADHEVDPHYLATGKWVCYTCREPVLLYGRAVPLTADRSAPVLEQEPAMSAQP